MLDHCFSLVFFDEQMVESIRNKETELLRYDIDVGLNSI